MTSRRDCAAREAQMITVGASAYSRTIDFARMGEIARSVGAYLFADIAHIAGLVAAGSTPHRFRTPILSLPQRTKRCGPRGGLVLCRAAHAKALDSAVFPAARADRSCTSSRPRRCASANVSSPSSNVLRTDHQEFPGICRCHGFPGYKIVSGGTDNHLFLVDLRPTCPTHRKKAQDTLDLATSPATRTPCRSRRARLPGIRHPPWHTSSDNARMVEADMDEIAGYIDAVLRATGTERQDA